MKDAFPARARRELYIYILANVTNEHYLFLDCIYISLIVASCNSSFTEVLLSGAECRCAPVDAAGSSQGESNEGGCLIEGATQKSFGNYVENTRPLLTNFYLTR